MQPAQELNDIRIAVAQAQETYAEMVDAYIDRSITPEDYQDRRDSHRREIEALLRRRARLHRSAPVALTDRDLQEIMTDLQSVLDDDMETLRWLQREHPDRSDGAKQVLQRATERQRLLSGLAAEMNRRGLVGPDGQQAERLLVDATHRDEEVKPSASSENDPVNAARDLVAPWLLSMSHEQRADALDQLKAFVNTH